MKVQASLLCLAIVSALATAQAAAPTDKQSPEEKAAAVRAAVVARANALVSSNPGAVHRANADVFTVSDVVVDANGSEHVRYERTFDGLPMIGGDFVVHSRNGKLSSVSQTLTSAQRPSLRAQVSRDQAIVEAGAHFGTQFFGAPTARTVVYARNTVPVLAHEVVFNGI